MDATQGHVPLEPTGSPMQQFAVVDDRAAYLPLHGFTAVDLGYQQGDAVSNIVNKLDDAPMTVPVPRALRPDLERP